MTNEEFEAALAAYLIEVEAASGATIPEAELVGAPVEEYRETSNSVIFTVENQGDWGCGACGEANAYRDNACVRCAEPAPWRGGRVILWNDGLWQAGVRIGTYAGWRR